MFHSVKTLVAVGALSGVSLICPLATSGTAATPPSGGYASTAFSINWDGAHPVADQPFSGQNSTGAGNFATVTDWSANSVDFVVSFPGVGGIGGIALVDTDASGFCTPTSWWHSASTEKVAIHCYLPSTFGFYYVAYTRQVAAGGSYAYAQASRPTLPSYTPDPSYQYATSHKRMTVTRRSVGRYTITIPGVVSAGGTIAVGSTGQKNAVCRVDSWKPTSSSKVSAQQVKVRCDQPWGDAIDSPFVIVYASGINILGAKPLGTGSWINAGKPYAKDYVPAQYGLQPPDRVHQGSPGEYHTSGGYWLDCTSAPAHFASTPWLLQTAGDFTYVTQLGTTHDVCELDDF